MVPYSEFDRGLGSIARVQLGLLVQINAMRPRRGSGNGRDHTQEVECLHIGGWKTAVDAGMSAHQPDILHPLSAR